MHNPAYCKDPLCQNETCRMRRAGMLTGALRRPESEVIEWLATKEGMTWTRQNFRPCAVSSRGTFGELKDDIEYGYKLWEAMGCYNHNPMAKGGELYFPYLDVIS